MSTHQPNRIQALIERRLLAPAYVGMLAGLLIRSVALVLSVAVPYAGWPVLAKMLIELCAAIGMVGCADIVLSAASAARAGLDREIHALRSSAEFQANPRIAPARYAQVQASLDAARALAVEGLERERGREWIAILFAGAITVSYGVLFGFTVLASASWITVAVEIIGVAAIPFITWYVSAQYRESQASPEDRAKSLALAAVDQRLVSAQVRFADGLETGADLDLMDASTEATPYHNRLVRALRRPDTSIVYLTTPELYILFGVGDSTAQSSIRRIVRKAGDGRQHGVIKDAKSGAWLTPRSAVVELFPHLIGAGHMAGKRRTSVTREPGPHAGSGGHGPDSARTVPGQQPNTGEHDGAPDASVQLVMFAGDTSAAHRPDSSRASA